MKIGIGSMRTSSSLPISRGESCLVIILGRLVLVILHICPHVCQMWSWYSVPLPILCLSVSFSAAAACVCVAVLPEVRDSFWFLLAPQFSYINLFKIPGLECTIVISQKRVWGTWQKKKNWLSPSHVSANFSGKSEMNIVLWHFLMANCLYLPFQCHCNEEKLPYDWILFTV